MLLNTPTNLFAELEHLQRELQQAFAPLSRPNNIRAVANGAFPLLNVGSQADGIEIQAFAPGIDPATLDVQLHRGVLTIAGERPAATTSEDGKQAVYARERFSGRFKRSVNLPDDADPGQVQARYRDGILYIHVARRASAQPRRIQIQ